MGKKKDTLVSAIEISLDPGRVISYGEVRGFINDLEDIKHRINDLVKQRDYLKRLAKISSSSS